MTTETKIGTKINESELKNPCFLINLKRKYIPLKKKNKQNAIVKIPKNSMISLII